MQNAPSPPGGPSALLQLPWAWIPPRENLGGLLGPQNPGISESEGILHLRELARRACPHLQMEKIEVQRDDFHCQRERSRTRTQKS